MIYKKRKKNPKKIWKKACATNHPSFITKHSVCNKTKCLKMHRTGLYNYSLRKPAKSKCKTAIFQWKSAKQSVEVAFTLEEKQDRLKTPSDSIPDSYRWMPKALYMKLTSKFILHAYMFFRSVPDSRMWMRKTSKSGTDQKQKADGQCHASSEMLSP